MTSELQKWVQKGIKEFHEKYYRLAFEYNEDGTIKHWYWMSKKEVEEFLNDTNMAPSE